jgi:hypothetical protein
VEFVVHLFFRKFLGREITDALNRYGIILERQFERPGAVFVVGVLHVGGYGTVANGHGVDIINNCRSAKAVNMKIILRVVAVLLIIFGCIWFLQGVNVLPGSFMTGQVRWAVYGGIAMMVGIRLLFAVKKRTRKG